MPSPVARDRTVGMERERIIALLGDFHFVMMLMLEARRESREAGAWASAGAGGRYGDLTAAAF